MKHRDIFKMLLLSVVTLGIYQLFWIKQTRDEMLAKGAKIPPLMLLLLPAISLTAITLLLLIVVIVNSVPGTSTTDSFIPLISLVTVVAMPVILFYWFYRYCQGVEHVTQGHMSLATSFLLFIVLYLFSVGFVWPLVIQDAFNKVSDGPDNRPADPSYPEPPHPNQHPAPTPSPASTSAPADNPAATTTAASGSDGPVLYRR